MLIYLLLCIATVPLSLAAQSNEPMYHEKIQEVRNEFNGNVVLSTPDECRRTCREGDPPKTCYYHFTLENYSVMGAACQFCVKNGTFDPVPGNCQCVLADGVERGVLTANRMIPGPSIQVCQGDKVVIDVENHMTGMETSIHWHGVLQHGSQYYDGVSHVTQCSIMQGTTFRYQWAAAVAGTHFWHAHSGLQEINGIYGSLVIRQPPSEDPNSNLYDYDLPDHIVLMSDWMHVDGSQKFPGLLKGEAGQAPVSLLINGKGRYKDPDTGSVTNVPLEVFKVKSGRRYRFRLITAFSTVCPAQISFEGHQLTIITADGEPVQPVAINTIISFSGERYDFVITADQPVDAYWIQLRGLGECGEESIQTLGILRYENGPDAPSSSEPTYDDGLPVGIILNPLDAVCHVPREDAVCMSQLKNARHVNERILQEQVDLKILLPNRFFYYNLEELFLTNTYKSYLIKTKYFISLVDGISFETPPAPPLSQFNDIDPKLFCNGNNRPADCGEDCRCIHTIDIPLNAVVEVVLVDEVQSSNVSHPFHLHGHAFNVIGMGHSPDANFTTMENVIDLDKRGLLQRNLDSPPGKDTITVPNNGYVIFRFVAQNPGWWLFHCHFLYHMEIGMDVILHVGTNADLPPIPPNFPRCGNHLPPITLT